MYELKNVESITIEESTEYIDSVKIGINHNGYQTTVVTLNRADFVALMTQGGEFLESNPHRYAGYHRPDRSRTYE